jgi:hypothetical protein
VGDREPYEVEGAIARPEGRMNDRQQSEGLWAIARLMGVGAIALVQAIGLGRGRSNDRQQAIGGGDGLRWVCGVGLPFAGIVTLEWTS